MVGQQNIHSLRGGLVLTSRIFNAMKSSTEEKPSKQKSLYSSGTRLSKRELVLRVTVNNLKVRKEVTCHSEFESSLWKTHRRRPFGDFRLCLKVWGRGEMEL